ncbi:MAG: lamin tail domain-containing protein [Thermoplasmata archaeon]|nr:lamin tail domain-containing protein [Thermoplasmata archaeon]
MPPEDDKGKLGVILILIMTIVVSIVIFNGFIPEVGDGNPDVYIPDYPAGEFVEYVNDGDTFKTVEGDYVRLLGINTEETGMPHSSSAKHRLEELLNSGEIRLESDIEDTDRYDRLLRYVWAGDVFVNLELVREGHAHVYVIPPNIKYWDDFIAAEKEAIANQNNLWQPSEYDIIITELEPVQGSGADGLNIERVTFRNEGTASIDMTGWTVKDESTHIYEFQDFVLSPGQSVSLRSGEGTDTMVNVYWHDDSSVWNNDGDVCFLRDGNGLLVDGWRYDPVDDGGYTWTYY